MAPEQTPLPIERESMDPNSMSGRMRLIQDAFRKATRKVTDGDDEPTSLWAEEIYDDHLIAQDGDDIWRYPYTVTDTNQVTFGEREQVTVQVSYTPVGGDESEAVTESVEHSDWGPITESLDGVPKAGDVTDDAGWEWKVRIIRPGVSQNGVKYTSKVLREAVPLYEGAKAFDGHRDNATRRASPVGGIIGYHRSVEAGPDGALYSHFKILRSARPIRDLFVAAFQEGRQDLIGFSHDVHVDRFTSVTEGGRQAREPSRIVKVSSVDTVADPSAGGALERLVAGGDGHEQKGGAMPPTRDEIIAALNDDPELASAVREAVAVDEGQTSPADNGGTTQVTETVLEPDSITHRFVLREALEASTLPEDKRKALKEKLKGQPMTETQIAAAVREASDIWDAIRGSEPSRLPGQGAHVQVTDELDKLQAALDGMIAGRSVAVGWNPALESEGSGDKVAPFHSIHQAFAAVTGIQPYGYGDTADHNKRILAAAVECFAHTDDRTRLTESVTSSTWANALRDSMTKRAIMAYRIPQRQAWRRVASEITPVNDFRTQNRFRVGGYDTLSTVGQGSAYPALVSPTDEQATYAVAKRGGVDDLTMETIANDDVGAVRAIPTNMGLAAILTLYRAFFIAQIADNPTIYDAVALFAAGHNNTDAAAALSQSTYATGRQKMRSQSRLGETSGALSYIPRILLTPNELEDTGFRLTTSAVAVSSNQDATEPNLAQGTEHIVIDEWTDANDWVLVADPSMAPTIEVGFYRGMEDPEILIQDQPAVGSVFTADKITYKVRHIWGLVNLDFRSFYRGQG